MPMLNIGSTKQLFFDDYLIESLVNAKQGLNPAVKVDDNPVIQPERPWEGNFMRPNKVIFDPIDQIFKMWYSSATITVRLENGKPVPGGAAGLVLDTQGSVIRTEDRPLSLDERRREGIAVGQPRQRLDGAAFLGSEERHVPQRRGRRAGRRQPPCPAARRVCLPATAAARAAAVRRRTSSSRSP